MAKARKRVRDAAGDNAGGDEDLLEAPRQFARALGSLSGKEASSWRLCPQEECRRSRECMSDALNCSIDFDEQLVWLGHAVAAGCAGLSPIAAARAAERHVLARRNGAKPSTGAGDSSGAMAFPSPRRRASTTEAVPMGAASKRLRAAAAAASHIGKLEFVDTLREFHNTHRLWRYCRKQACKRARRCCGYGDECARRFPRITTWIQQQLEQRSAPRAKSHSKSKA